MGRKICMALGIFLLGTLLLWSIAGQQAEAVLDKVTTSSDLISFHIISGQTGLISGQTAPTEAPTDAAGSIRVVVESSLGEWAFSFLASPLTVSSAETSSPGGYIEPRQLLIKTPYTNGFESLDLPRLVGKGTTAAPPPYEAASLQFRYMASGQEKPGLYEGNIYSPDAGGAIPPIHVRLVVDPPTAAKDTTESAGVSRSASPSASPGASLEKLESASSIKMSLSPTNIHFSVTGQPGEYEADSQVVLTVESTEGFIVKACASPLKSSQGNIPPARILVKQADGNYHSLDQEVVVLQRAYKSERNPTSSTRLWFKLQTGWDDPAGEYSGTITFTCLPPP